MNQKGGKIRPFKPAEWGELCDQQIRRLIKAGYFPLVSLIMGLPEKRPRTSPRPSAGSKISITNGW